MRALACSTLALLTLLSVSAQATAEPPAPMDDRVKILEVEMRRGPAQDLAPFLTPDAHKLSRVYAMRALGRIGDRGEAVPMLAALLEKGAEPLRHLIWCAGLAQSDKLHEPLRKYLKHEKPEIVADAAEALGWTGKPDAVADLTGLLNHPKAEVRAGALMGLGRLRPEGALERIAGFVHDADPGVQRAAGFACWLTAGARKRAAKAVDPKWDGDLPLAKTFLPLLSDPSPDRVMDGLRVLGSLLPTDLTASGVTASMDRLLTHADARVTQDVVWRILAPRDHAWTTTALLKAATHVDPKVRQMAIEALGDRDLEAEAIHLAMRGGGDAWTLEAEPDLRVREAWVVTFTKLGDEAPWNAWSKSSERSEKVELALRQMTAMRVLLASKRKEALDEALALALRKGLRGGTHPVAVAELLAGLEGKDDPRIEPWVTQQLPGAGPFDVDDVYVASSIIGLAAKNTYWGCFHRLKASAGPGTRDVQHDEVRLALADAFGTFAKHADCPPADKSWATRWLTEAMYGDASAWVRAKARASLDALGVEGLPDDDVLPPTDWKGLPRPAKPILGVDLTKGGAWLSEREILQLGDVLFGVGPRLRFVTTQGTFDVTLDPDAAPVHCVSAVLAVAAGVYADTRWHRVVPNFVIQGGDPHGHGAGNGGWYVPDEITPRSYVRGALGMPKSRKDDGGCQLFFMHTHYIPLDGRYTNYGEVVSGMDVVDRIRVGDRILSAEIVRPN